MEPLILKIININFLFKILCRPDLESVWGNITTDSSLPDGNVPLVIDAEYFPSRDAVISLPTFIKFWYV